MTQIVEPVGEFKRLAGCNEIESDSDILDVVVSIG